MRWVEEEAGVQLVKLFANGVVEEDEALTAEEETGAEGEAAENAEEERRMLSVLMSRCSNGGLKL